MPTLPWSPEEKKKGEHQLYSAKALAGFCLMANNGWNERANTGWLSGAATRQLVLNSNGTCSGCARLPKLAGYVGVIEQAELAAGEAAYECGDARGECGVVAAEWPSGSERGLPDWYVSHAKRLAKGGVA